jgi:uncharacterized protein YfbU (UPF0304 family)
MKSMDLNRGQQLLVAMIADLSRDPAQRDLDHEFIAKAVRDGNFWAIEATFPGIFPGDVASDEQVDYVGRVLSMWSAIETSYAALDPKDKQKVNDAGGYPNGPRFRGFDGNNETTELSIAQCYLEMGRFPDLADRRDYNSHMPTDYLYKRMLGEYLSTSANLHGGHLSADQLVGILTPQR